MPTVRDAMTEDVVVVRPDEPLERVLRTFASESIHGVPVVEEGSRLIGIVTSVDVVRALASGEWRELTAGEVTRKAVTVNPDEDLETALDLMAAVGEDRAVVVEDGEVVGVLTVLDAIRVLLGE
ncbi:MULTISPECIES: CBS domain-containing protein [unclassified Methanopyrus]|uniref:CBS domain-containing protein n=1 Tax=unclassified Methanopyrus TaxID=2684913 RepID=UPI000B4B6F59|nr:MULTISPECIES: CBS domain-containing protein [unclassified Methanopyrus]